MKFPVPCRFSHLSSLISSLLDKDGRAEKVFVRKYTRRHGNLMQCHFPRGKKTPKFLQTSSTVLASAHYRNNETSTSSDFRVQREESSGRNGQPSSLSWSTRLRIAKGTARGLAYLHECSPRKFVHGDVKPSNILLDNKFQPYISDFGLNRLINITGNNPSSSGGFIGGALPYLKSVQTERPNNYRPPEALVSGNRPNQKWDVYSFGVVLLELLTGKSPELSPSASTSIEVPDLVTWVRKGFEDENPLSDMVDPLLLQEVHAKKEVIAVFHVALACAEADPEVRPRMKTVSENLERIGT